jgi:serine/threonine protein kinase
MTIPENIDRFQIVRELGKGSQGVVYLASDPRLERQVALKTLHMHLSGDGDRPARLLQEARTVSKLQHPNIIPVYEAGAYQGQPYLVFEYVDGISLKDLIKREGALVVHRSVNMMRQILEGISYAHQQGIVHRDLSPSNILIGDNDTPRIMDFGISIMIGGEKNRETDLSGTPCYMSPEHFSERPIGPRSDIFSLGLILFEMLVGHPAVQADNHYAVMYKIANEPLLPPSSENQTVDKKLDRMFLRAVEKDPASRYADALEMKRELDEYLAIDESGEAGQDSQSQAHSTLDFLMRRIRHQSDFPSFSQHIMEINKKASVSRSNAASASELANAILKDYSLTNKLLKLVNSAFYGQLAGEVTTVSRAVVVLGFEQVSMAASSLMLFDHLQNKSQSDELKDAALSSFMSGIIAKDLARKLNFPETEEAFICSMFHNLGRHLVLFYFPEESNQIKNLMAQKGLDEETATRIVLGISHYDLGAGIAKSWKFPDKIVHSMRSPPKGKAEKPKSETDMLWKLSGFSNELCSVASSPEDGDKEEPLTSLLKRFEESFPVSKKQMHNLLHSAHEKVEEYSNTLDINLNKSPFMSRMSGYFKAREESIPDTTKSSSQEKPQEADLDNYQTLEISKSPSPSSESKDPHSVFINGIQEITNTLLEDYELNDVLTMILETMYRGFRFNLVLLCFVDMNRKKMSARLGFGKNIEKVVEKFSFKLGQPSDVFSLAMSQGKDLGIDDSADPRIKKAIPEWYRQAVSAPAFVLYPITVSKAPIALIYADRERSGRVISGSQLNYMKTLCNQLVLAIKQKKQKI